jgi:hypothetical protein
MMPRQVDVAVFIALLVVFGVLGAIGYVGFLIVRWARRNGRRPWLWLLATYIAANVLWAILHGLLVQR